MILNHVGLTVSDLDASLAFYRDVVGFAVKAERRIVEGDWFDALTGGEGATIEFVLVGDDRFTLQLVRYLNGGGAAAPTGHVGAGNVHLCVEVDDVDARWSQLNAEGRYRLSPVVNIMGTANRSFYVSDPDGVPVELLRPAGERLI
ncbi:MAG TPA: VOC family protein [Acidimicrobiia bacterium]|nr:VOC family protein [Acidimicrobiia bacterium]